MESQFGTLLATITALWIATASAFADYSCCEYCGWREPCRKVCRLVCEDKKIETILWGCQREDFCVPRPSAPGDRHCEDVGAAADPNRAVCGQPKRFFWREWTPSTAKISRAGS